MQGSGSDKHRENPVAGPILIGSGYRILFYPSDLSDDQLSQILLNPRLRNAAKIKILRANGVSIDYLSRRWGVPETWVLEAVVRNNILSDHDKLLLTSVTETVIREQDFVLRPIDKELVVQLKRRVRDLWRERMIR